MRALLLSLLIASAAAAQDPPPAEPLPPPGINDPGVVTTPETARQDTSLIGEREPLPRDGEAPIKEKIPGPPSDETAPTVTIRMTEEGDRVEEYRQNGRITMVKVTPQRGPSYMLIDTNGDGLIDRSDSDAPVAPVYYKLYEWN